MRIEEITDTRVHDGYRRVHVMFRREGHQDTVERVSLPALPDQRPVAAFEAATYEQGRQAAPARAHRVRSQRGLEQGLRR